MTKANNPLAETRAIETRNEFGLSNTEAFNIFEVLKYNSKLYSKVKTDADIIVESDYAELAEEALDKNKISESRYNEYLIEGGYGYLVFANHHNFKI
jgi:hypothetical protein